MGFLSFDYILSQMFYDAEVNVCTVKGEGWIRMKASRQSILGKQKKNKIKMYIIFLFIANRDGLKSFGEGAGAINHNRVNCGLLPLYRLAYVKFYIALFDSMTVTKRHLGFYTVYCEKGMSVTLYIYTYINATDKRHHAITRVYRYRSKHDNQCLFFLLLTVYYTRIPAYISIILMYIQPAVAVE